MPSRFFFRLVQRSLVNRLGKWLTAVLAVAMGASLVSASLALSTGMEAKMSRALRAYGANILLVPAPAPGLAPAALGGAHLFVTVSEDLLAKLGGLARDLPLVGFAPFLYAIADIGQYRVALTGTWPDAARQINPWWRIEGAWIRDRTEIDEAILGTSVAQKLGLGIGAPLTLTVQNRTRTFRIVGILSTGGSEDEQILVTLRAAQELARRAGQVSLIQVSALAADRRVEDIARSLEAGLFGVEARTQLRLVRAEERLLARIALLLSLIAAVVMVASALAVAASVATSVLERTREIGLMKALGASRFGVSRILLAEAGLIGTFGGLLGGAAGLLLAQLIARSIFGGFAPISTLPLVVSVGTGVGVAILASLISVRRAASIMPGIVLRGE